MRPLPSSADTARTDLIGNGTVRSRPSRAGGARPRAGHSQREGKDGSNRPAVAGTIADSGRSPHRLAVAARNPFARHVSECAQATPAVVLALALMLLAELAWGLGITPISRSGLEQWLLWTLSVDARVPFPALSLMTAAILALWLRWRGERWKLRLPILAVLLVESTALGLMVAMLVKAYRLLAAVSLPEGPASLAWAAPDSLALFPAVIAAGVHEEVLFRLVGLGGFLAWLRWMGQDSIRIRWVVLLAISTLFAALHYSILNPAGEPLEWGSFACRMLLGCGLGAIYLWRGLALAIGVHCAYNVFALI